MKKSLLLLASLLGFITTNVNAQCGSGNTLKPSQNCRGAIPICQLSITYPSGYICGPGEIPGEIPSSSCLASNEKNTTWFVFKVYKSGKLKFKIRPLDVIGTNNGGTDYDWALFKLPAGQQNTPTICEQLKNNFSWQFSCNYAAGQGVTGMYDTTGTQQLDVQNAGGTKFNKTKNVSIGEYYVLAIDNFSGGTLTGYTINFADPSNLLHLDAADISPSEDTIVMSSISQVPNCTSNSLIFSFSSPVRCDSVNASKFEIKGANPPYTIQSVLPLNASTCSLNGQTETYKLLFTPALVDPNYKLILKKTVKDLCQNEVKLDSINFAIVPSFTVSISSVNGLLIGTYIEGATYQWSLNGMPIQGATQPSYSPVTNGVYAVTVTKGTCVQMGSITFNTIGVKENISNLVKVYPNPSKGVFQLKVTEKTNCTVSDITGKVLWQKNSVETGETIDLSNQPEGVYFLKVKTLSGSETIKLIVQQ
ncbi:Por secretion system C-terminal sorting domain-containing protein [Flexibacter flexilis DSM 6793]|uniref:Por secretion system C-terminal sorting domain-containing protein n=1 Tax=Flexibacter flexilis DSM 6793 TaxID=927664 RepID=A0A1I1JT05_9BACT|nr:T9SS type A sorting domain-containing protein [Flexibacter flexilis]SFC51495.1 Por secretion system C-terminal sorting domain-containing protein [Flexibacter flexilis DSM 6793]